jgi:opacity protein-like surface antigen
MRYSKISALAGAVALLSTATFAADIFVPPPPQPAFPPVVPVSSGWYLRGFVGASNEVLSNVSHPDFLITPQFAFIEKGTFDTAPFAGGGIGYQWNSWVRTDATVEYRGRTTFHAISRFFNAPPPPFVAAFNSTEFTASKSEVVGLANLYLDLGTWWCVSPFIGAGIGAAQIKIDHLRALDLTTGGGSWAESATKTNFAWALHAGVAYKVNPNFALEFSYRYLRLKDGTSGLLVNLDPTIVPINPLAAVTFNNIQSHDVMLGARFLMQ